jgi:hypothetical protein
MHDRRADPGTGGAGDRLVFRRGRLRKREDDEVRMMRDALASLDDDARVKRLLLELGRFYNPVADGPVVGPATRRAVLACLEAGDREGARVHLEAHLAAYLRVDEPQAPAQGPRAMSVDPPGARPLDRDEEP